MPVPRMQPRLQREAAEDYEYEEELEDRREESRRPKEILGVRLPEGLPDNWGELDGEQKRQILDTAIQTLKQTEDFQKIRSQKLDDEFKLLKSRRLELEERSVGLEMKADALDDERAALQEDEFVLDQKQEQSGNYREAPKMKKSALALELEKQQELATGLRARVKMLTRSLFASLAFVFTLEIAIPRVASMERQLVESSDKTKVKELVQDLLRDPETF